MIEGKTILSWEIAQINDSDAILIQTTDHCLYVIESGSNSGFGILSFAEVGKEPIEFKKQKS